MIMIATKYFGLIRLLITFAFSTYILLTECSVRKVNYGVVSDCIGKQGMNPVLFTLDNVSHADCGRLCLETEQCRMFFHSSENQSCSFHNRTLTGIETAPDVSSRCFMTDNTIESWIVEIINESSIHPGWPSTQMIGPPDTWRCLFRKDREGFLEARFSSEMYIEQIYIFEIRYAGGVSGISLLSPDGTWYPVWSTEQLEEVFVKAPGRILCPELTITDFKTATVHIDIGARSVLEQIDAIGVSGKR